MRLPRPIPLAGLAFGAALQLVLFGLVQASFDGGLSDRPAAPPPVYPTL